MSILRNIIQEMYVDPEILTELDDEQKQILFFKMREEQINRYWLFESEWEKKAPEQVAKKNANGKRVQWLQDEHGEPWVWIMGEHPDDRTIEQILDDETHEKARILAEKEMEREEEELKKVLRCEQIQMALERHSESRSSAGFPHVRVSPTQSLFMNDNVRMCSSQVSCLYIGRQKG